MDTSSGSIAAAALMCRKDGLRRCDGGVCTNAQSVQVLDLGVSVLFPSRSSRVVERLRKHDYSNDAASLFIFKRVSYRLGSSLEPTL